MSEVTVSTIPVIPEPIRAQVLAHAAADPAGPVAGLLVADSAAAGAVRVTGALPAPDATEPFAGPSWDALVGQQQQRFPGSRIVGWYRSQPGSGASFAQRDAFLHTARFPDHDQFGYVVDPESSEEGLMGWRDGAAIAIAARRGGLFGWRSLEPSLAATAAAPAAAKPRADGVGGRSRRTRVMTRASGIVAILLAGFVAVALGRSEPTAPEPQRAAPVAGAQAPATPPPAALADAAAQRQAAAEAERKAAAKKAAAKKQAAAKKRTAERKAQRAAAKRKAQRAAARRAAARRAASSGSSAAAPVRSAPVRSAPAPVRAAPAPVRAAPAPRPAPAPAPKPTKPSSGNSGGSSGPGAASDVTVVPPVE